MLRRARPWLGTLVEIRVEAMNAADESAVLEASFAAIAEVHRALSFHDAGSELSLLNREASMRSVAVSPLVAELLREALAIAEMSDDLFDPTIAGELVVRGARPHPHANTRIPASASALAGEPDPRASWRDVEIDEEQRVRFHRPLWLDFGGIAKGFAVDRALTAALAHGAHAATVNAGGDLATFGTHEEIVQLRVPGATPSLIDIGALRDGAAAGSACGFEDIPTHFDGRTRRALHTPRAVAVFAPRCLHADALTKPVLCDPVAAQVLLAHYGASACVIDSDDAPRVFGAAA